jgi:hypothetical protein
MWKFLVFPMTLTLVGCATYDNESPCEPGDRVDCFCDGGMAGLKDCLDDGSGWDECVCTCSKDCTDRVCGSDPLCGYSCGDCPAGYVCTGEGACEPDNHGLACDSREDCASPLCLVCQNKECTDPPPICQNDDDCCMGFRCNFGTCIPDGTGECRANPPQPIGLQIGVDPWECMGCSGGMAGTAQVLYNHSSGNQWSSEVWLWFEEEEYLEKIYVDLPEGYEVPLDAGERIWAQTTVDAPWWVDETFDVREEDGGDHRFRIYDTSFVVTDYEPDCIPVADENMGCGTIVFPGTVIDPESGLPETTAGQGASVYSVTSDGTRAHQSFVGRFYQYVELWCMDVPGGWQSHVDIDLTDHSRCTCTDDTHCSLDRICEERAQRCVPNLCHGMPPCNPGEVCDPFHGVCVPAPIERCESDWDCASLQICNRHTGFCVEDVCKMMDCMGSCSSQLGRCYTCLQDCECWPGRCDPESNQCDPDCRSDKIGIDRDNQEAFEMFHVCIDERLEEAGALLEKYVGAVDCRSPLPNGPCDPDVEQVCTGDLQGTDPEDRVDEPLWYGLCALSRLPLVHRIEGGYYLP